MGSRLCGTDDECAGALPHTAASQAPDRKLSMDTLARDTVPPATRVHARRARLGAWVGIAVLLALIGAAIWLWPAEPASKKQNPFANAPVPVLTAAAVQRDVPIWLDGLGTVQAYQTVTVKAMVDGPLLEVDFAEGQPVTKGQVLARIDPRTYKASLDQAVAKKAQDEAQLANAKVDLARYQKLVRNNYTTEQTADTQKATVAQLSAQVEADQAMVDNARTLLSYTTITSPLTGLAGIRQVDPGNIVHAADTTGIVTLTQLKPISVLFTLPQQNLQQVAAAVASGKATVEALDGSGGPDGGKPLDTGTLSVLDNQVDPTTGTIKLKATFPNERQLLWPGAFVRVRVQVATAHDAVVVPAAAVQRGPTGEYVYLAGEDRVAHRVPVTVGYQDAQTTVIADGLKAGDVVVTDGASRLSDGKKLAIAPAPGAPVPALPKPVEGKSGKHP